MAQAITIPKLQLEEIFDQKLKPISDSIGEMNDSIAIMFLYASFEEIKQKLGTFETSLDEVENENHFLKHETMRFSNGNTKILNFANDLSRQLDDIQKYQRRVCWKVIGILFQQGKVTNDLLIKIGSLMGLELANEEISVSHRLPMRNESYS
jgi:septal ring factor EnvC (AmiA/AmiB activator)